MSSSTPVSEAVRILKTETLSNDAFLLRKYTCVQRRADGTEQTIVREAYESGGDGAGILLCDKTRRTVVLTRQFRLPAFINGHPDGMLIEVPAGLLDGEAPDDAVRREAEEETGFRVTAVNEVINAYPSPGAVTQRLHLFIAEYTSTDRVGTGGGNVDEGEHIEVIEVPFDEALAMIDTGDIVDAKTIILLYHAALKGVFNER